MNKKLLLLLFHLITVSGIAYAQIIGETDAVSFPKANFIRGYANASTLGQDCDTGTEYEQGYCSGYQIGYEDGLLDSEDCSKYLTPYGIAYSGYLGIEYEQGHRDGWNDAYTEAYDEQIAIKSAGCSASATFNEFFCQCICIPELWYYDGDDDGFSDLYTVERLQCESPEPLGEWKRSDEVFGYDCDDTDANVWSFNQCGLCSFNTDITTWYYDADDDGYHGSTEQSCNVPITGITSLWKTTTIDEDCDDTNAEYTVPITWYYFKDDDNYYDELTSSQQCQRPSSGIAAKWRKTSGQGPDCNSEDPSIHGPVDWYYDEDGDGYHNKIIGHFNQCVKPEMGEPNFWKHNSQGEDCDDENPNQFVLNACDECTNSTANNKAYIDFDGDGYHSIELDLSMLEPDGIGDYGYPCANSPLYIEPKILYNYPIFRDQIFKGELYSLFDEIDDVPNKTDYQYLPGVHTLFWTRYLCVDDPSTCQLYYHNVRYSDNKFWNEWYLTDYFELPTGKKLWVQSFKTAAQGYARVSPGWKNNINFDAYNIREESIYILFEDALGGDSYVSATTLGKDCDDFDPLSMFDGAGQWVYDLDEDGYHEGDIAAIDAQCIPPNPRMILLTNSLGVDCDDDDSDLTINQNWYFYGDEDNYYSTVVQACKNPGIATGLIKHWRIDAGEGEDCDDTDQYANIDKNWYKDNDGDGYYGTVVTSCLNPGLDTGDSEKWTVNSGLGKECDDDNPELTDSAITVYLDLDGDGYHSVVKNRDCGNSVFPAVDLEGSNFPVSLLQSGLGNYFVDITNSPYSFEYNSYEYSVQSPDGLPLGIGPTIVFTSYDFPDALVKNETLGLDCDDLNSDVIMSANWYLDADHDGYHVEESLVSTCSPPVIEDYITIENSLGVDCDDTENQRNKIQTWYYDLDADGFYTDTQMSCQYPGKGWRLTSSLGADLNDSDPFSPALQPLGHWQDFVIPSLFELITNDTGEEELIYNGEIYDKDAFSLTYHGVTFGYDDLIFEGVSVVADTGVYVQPDKLVIAARAALINANIEIVEDPIVTTTTAARQKSLSIEITDDIVFDDPPNEWYEDILKRYSGYTNIMDDVPLETSGVSGQFYFSEFFDPNHLSALALRMNDYNPYFTIKIQSFEEIRNNEGFVKIVPVIDKTFLGQDPTPSLIFTVKKTWDGRVEYVVSVHDDTFIATPEELVTKGWMTDTNMWANPEDESLYNIQLDKLRKYRILMTRAIASDPIVLLPPPAEDSTDKIDPEIYPEYGYKDSYSGILTKWVEFYELGYFLGHYFEMPRGMWDPEGYGDESRDDYSGRWQTRSPASVGGVVDESLTQVKDMSEMIELAQSLVHSETWSQILKSLANFNIGDQMESMFSAVSDEYDKLIGVYGSYVQYYTIGKTAVRTLSAIYSSWKAVSKIGKKLIGAKPDSPHMALDQKIADFNNTFKGKINESPQFKALPEASQTKFLEDISEYKGYDADGVFDDTNVINPLADAIAKDPDFINNWKKLDDAGVDDVIRTNLNHLTTINKWADEGIEVAFESVDNGAKILSKNGDELGQLLTERTGDVLEISDDFIVSAASTASKKFDGLNIRSNTGETFLNAGFVKNADGSLGFVEDVSSYGSQLVQGTIKQRGALRKSMAGIKATEDAHHLIPVQLLKQNDVVKKAVEAGFEFNTTKNGLAIEKFVKKTGVGRHGPHPNYTKQIGDALDKFNTQTPNLTNQQAKEFLEIITDDIKNTIQTTNSRINHLNLGL